MKNLSPIQLAYLKNIEQRYQEIVTEMGDMEQTDLKKMIELKKEMNTIEEKVEAFQQWEKINIKIGEWKKMNSMATESEKKEINKEISQNEKELEQIAKNILKLLEPKSNSKNKNNFLIEIRGAAGGEEANLFTRDLANCYLRSTKNQKWTTEILEIRSTSSGGYSFFSMLVKKPEIYSNFQWESGVHRVQRIPKTETQGRIHTSTITVAIMEERAESEMPISTKDLKIETFRSSGAGGQHVNTTNSAIRITHIPTKIVVSCQSGRSQHDNKDKAMRILRARIYQSKKAAEQTDEDKKRSEQIGMGKRSEKIRTYNYPQNRITDHRTGISLTNIERIMNGNILELWAKTKKIND